MFESAFRKQRSGSEMANWNLKNINSSIKKIVLDGFMKREGIGWQTQK